MTANALTIIAQNLAVSQNEVSSTIKSMVISAKGQHGATCSDTELMVVASTCARYDLNPLVKEAHAFVSNGKLSVMIGIDGWIKIMNRQPDFDGVEFEDHFNGDKLTSITCKIYSKSRSRPTCITEYLDECRQDKSQAWQKYPNRMLRNKALGQCIRVAFGVSEVIDDDEAARYPQKQREREINPRQERQFEEEKHIVDERGETLKKFESAFSACNSEAEIRNAAIQIRNELDISGTFEKFKNELVLMKNKHVERILNTHQIDTETGEILEGEIA